VVQLASQRTGLLTMREFLGKNVHNSVTTEQLPSLLPWVMQQILCCIIQGKYLQYSCEASSFGHKRGNTV
jgi:hypothetical protein